MPRPAANQRAMATTEMWIIIPCPAKRSTKITGTSAQAHPPGSAAMPRQPMASSAIAAGPRRRARNRSVSPPAQIITSADAVVPSV